MTDIPDDIQEHYKLQQEATKDGFIYVKIQKGMYGLPQGGWLAQNLKRWLAQHGFFQSNICPGL